MGHSVYQHRAWHAVRRQILERDHWQCQIGGPRCTSRATEVDHIVPFSQGGAKYDPSNLRAACRPCNVGRQSATRREAWRAGSAHITLVYGPPGAGKTTYVRERARPGDLIVDYDQLGVALGSPDRAHHAQLHPAISAARNAVLSKIRRGETGADRVWIISANPEARTLFPWHDCVVVDPGRDVVVEQAGTDRGRVDQGAYEAIDRWYRQDQDVGPSRDW